jgi:hypothetical protein
MAAVQQLQATIDRIRSAECSGDELLNALRHPSPVVRANAVERLGQPGPVQHALAIESLEFTARDPASEYRLMGTITLAHLTVAALMRLGGEAGQRGLALIAGWPEPDREGLVWFLRSERLLT